MDRFRRNKQADNGAVNGEQSAESSVDQLADIRKSFWQRLMPVMA